jgi:hypothetical protein
VKIKRKPSEDLQRIYFDRPVHPPEGVRFLLREVGITQIAVGTDYPFGMGACEINNLISAVPGLANRTAS